VLIQAVKATASISLDSSPNPSTAGQGVTFAATVSGSAGTPTGTVNFRDGAMSIPGCQAVALSGSTATCASATLAAGAHSITAQYAGNIIYNSATSAALTQTVNAQLADAAVALASSPNPSTAGQIVTFTATVSGTAGTPTGTVEFRDGAASISGCAARVLSAGTATCDAMSLAAGAHFITAQYAGNIIYNSATSAVLTQTVNAQLADAAVALASTPNPSMAGESVTFTATVSGTSGTPTGTVDFRDGATPVAGCEAVPLSAGSATCATNVLSPGSHSIAAGYGGDSTYNAATSPAVNQAVEARIPSVGAQAPTTVTFNPTGAAQVVRVTTTGNYLIEASGAQGGADSPTYGHAGGLGARVGGIVPLAAGDVLCVIVGMRPDGPAGAYDAGGGGGASFVFKSDATCSTQPALPLMAAGGGGGGGGSGGQATPDGASGGAPGGIGGAGGSAFSLGLSEYHSGGGGAGWLGPGQQGSPATFAGGGAKWTGGAGASYLGTLSSAGGFGGGGGAGMVCNAGCGSGGGGGYSGGGGGAQIIETDAGGGGSYNGGVGNLAATAAVQAGHGSVTITFDALLANAAVTLASSPNPSISGESVTFTATVAGSAGTPTGTVDFRDGAASIPGCAAVALLAGTARCDTMTLAAGTHSITAQYAGNTPYNAATSAALIQTVNAPLANSTVALISSSNPSTAGQSVTFTATVSGTSGTPTGTVDFRDGAASIPGCAAVALLAGTAACDAMTLAAGTHTITAQYAGNTTYNAATSAALLQTVNAPLANSSVALISSSNPSTAGQGVTFTATVSGTLETPAGTVDFRDGAASISGCAAVALSAGSATCTTSSLAAGAHSISAQYAGNTTYNAATSAPLTQTIDAPLADAAVAIASSPDPSAAGQSVTFTAAVSGTAGTPTGTVDFRDGTGSISGCMAVALSAGTAMCDTAGLAAGAHSITAQYSGDIFYNAATSPALTQTVNATPGNPAVALVSSPNPSTAGQSVTFAATVSGTLEMPTGSADFLDGAASIAGCAAVVLSAGRATCDTVSLAAGAHSITAQYSGDAIYNPATSLPVSQVVESPPAPPPNSSNVALASAGWTDGTPSDFPDGVQIDFAGMQTIDRVVVYTLQDNAASPEEPGDTLAFTQYGVTDFDIEAWDGSAGVTLATASGNARVKRTVDFAAFTTDRIRINVTHSVDGYVHLTEIEAWGNPASQP
jgi:hypothetical protein